MGFLKKSSKEDPPPPPPPPQEVDEDEALTDEDSSYGPVPPPPSGTTTLVEDHQAAYDLEKQQLGNGNNVSTDVEEEEDEDDDDDDIGMPDKHDPPSQDGNEILEEGHTHNDYEDDDDESVEIPPTNVVQRMIETEKEEYLEKESNGRFCRMGAIIACCLIILATILGVGFGTGAFTKNSASAAEEPADDANTDGGDVTPSGQGRSEDIMLFLAAESTVPSSLEQQGTAEAAAAEWLINQDPLQLGIETADDQARLLQRYALLTLWFADPEKAWGDSTGWLEAEDECTWFGVTCSQQDVGGQSVNLVTLVDIVDNNVKSTLPSDLALLESLTTLNLSKNDISGSLPASYGASFSALGVLNLEANKIESDITAYDWSGMTSMVELRISDNKFSGDVSSLSALGPTLVSLDLAQNSFGGPLPDSFSTLSSLLELNIQDNAFTGLIPNFLGDIQLRVLRAGFNDWDEGDIPLFIYTMTNLVELGLEECNLTGSIQGAFASLTSLQNVYLESNALTGSLPSRLLTMTNLEIITLQENQMSGAFPDISGMTGIRFLQMSSNGFTSTIPDTLGSLQNLLSLRLDDNVLTGGIPTSIASLPSLEILDLSRNALSGGLPINLGAMFSLRELYLSAQLVPDIVGSGLTGRLVSSIGNLGRLERLDLRANAFTGALPVSVADLDALAYINLSSNQFTGPVPDQIVNWSDTLKEADFSGNAFTGSMPVGICVETIETLIADCDLQCTCCTSCDSA